MGAQERTILISYIGISIFITIILIYFLFNLFKQHRQYKNLQEEKLISEINTAKAERNNIAAELHNDLAPYLSSIKMKLYMIETADQDKIEECSTNLSICIQQIRDIIKELSPISLYNLSFQEALRSYIETHKIKSVINVHLVEISEVELTHDQHNQIYRIIQEITYNAVKHSKAKNLSIEISKEDKVLLIRTADDGVGFDLNEVKNNRKSGYGLIGIESRIDYLKGSIDVNTRPNRGTKYNIRIPIG